MYVIALQKQPPWRTKGVVGREAILFWDGVVRLTNLVRSGVACLSWPGRG